MDSRNNVSLFNYNTKTVENLNMSKFSECDLSPLFSGKADKEGPRDFPACPLKEKSGTQLASPETNPIFDVYYSKIEKNVYVSGVDYLKSFKVFNYQY